MVLVAFGRRFRCRGDGCPVRQPAAKIAKVESHAKGACSVLHGRDASCLRRQPKIAKGESNGNKLVWLPLPNRILSSMQSKIAKVESHAKGACSVLHGRDASCLRRQPKIAKGESNGNKLVWLPLPNRILSSMQSKIAKVEHRANGLARVCIVQSRPARTILQKGFEEILRWGGDARFFSKSFALSYYQNL